MRHRRTMRSRSIGATVAIGLIGGIASQTALCQTPENAAGTFASQKLSNVPGASYGSPPLPSPEALVPQFNQALAPYGTAILLSNINEFDSAVSGLHRGTTNAGQYALEWDQDWNTLAGIGGLQTHAVAVGRYGIPASRIFGDNIDPSQEIYGAGGNVVVHMVFFYAEETLAHGQFNVAGGRMSFLSDFSASPLYCNFQNNAFCGNPKASVDTLSHSSYPDANWATRLRVRPIKSIYVQTGIYFDEKNIYQATEGYRSGFRFNSSDIDGETFPLEIGWEPSFGQDDMPGHYKIGFAYDNLDHENDYYDTAGSAFAETGLSPHSRKGSSSAWVLFDQMLLRQGKGATDGLIAIGGYYHNDANYATRADQFLLGGIDRAFWKARPSDTIGVNFSYTAVSGLLGKTEALQQELGLPITGNGGQFYDGITPGVQTHTMNLELNYEIRVFRGITFAPDLQYFIRPNAQSNLPDAALIGFKSTIELF